ncbi:MAG: hypothetical protein ACPLX7_10290, partial [Candidatus Kapaibacteriota bacterium]
MKNSDMVTRSQWETIVRICSKYKVNPGLILAIGWHETQWGRLGAGQQGWYLGYGYYPGSTVAEQYRGLENQLEGACKHIQAYLNPYPLDYAHLLSYSKNYWRAGDPT